MEEIGATLENKIRDRRETQTDPNGRRWEAWSASYTANYQYRRPGEDPPRGKLLERSGDMWDKPGGPTWLATSSSVRVGFDKAYATHHEFGTRTMPRRGLMFADPDSGTLSASDEAAVVDLVNEWLSGAI